MIPSPVNSGPVADRERQRDPGEPGPQVGVEQQQAAVGDDQAERHQRRGLVEAPELGVHARTAHQAARHRQADRDRDAEHHDRDDPERAAGEPEQLMGWVDGGHETWVVTGVSGRGLLVAGGADDGADDLAAARPGRDDPLAVAVGQRRDLCRGLVVERGDVEDR